MELANKLKEKRKALGLTMVELCLKTGIDQALLSKYENGRRVPSDMHLKKIAAGIDISFVQIKKWQAVDKIADILIDFENFSDVMMVAEERVAFLRSTEKFNTPNISVLVQSKIHELDKLKIEWQNKRPFAGLQLQKLNNYIKIKYTFNSNKIEGNTLSLQETQLVVGQGITIGGKSMREHLEAVNHAEAIDYIADLAVGKLDLDKRILLDLHQLILKSIEPENAGVFRKIGVRISGSEHIPPDALHLNELMDDYFLNYNIQKKTVHPVILAAEMHERLVSIHPFVDGNGRAARLLMNLILLKHGYTICILKGSLDARLRYYEALEEVQINNNPSPFYELIVDNCIESIKEHLAMT
jgi:Fic family protein